MKILIISQYYYPEQFQINEIAPEFVRRGHEVTVVTGLPNYPQGEIYDGYSVGEEVIDGVRVIRVKEHPRKNGPFHLLLNYWSFAHYGSKKIKKLEKFDVVFCYQLSPISILKPAVVYAKMNRIPLVTYCLDIWPESAKAHTSISFLFKLIASYSKKLYQNCDHIVVTSRPFIDYHNEVNGIDRSKMSYIPQHADTNMIEQDLTADDNGIVDFMYAGNMGKGQTLDVIVRAVAEIKDRKDFIVHMVGDGSQKTELEELTKEFGVQDKIVFYGNQRRDTMPGWYKRADALLITLRGNNAVGNTMPGKLQMYMTTGKPILGAINGAASEVINESSCGKCVTAGDYVGLSQLMADYINNPQEYKSCGVNGKKYFMEHFTLDKYCDDIERLLMSVV